MKVPPILAPFPYVTASHCFLAAVASSLKYHKLDIDEATLFSEIVGLNFYYHSNIKKLDVYSTCSPSIEYGILISRLGKRLGVKIYRGKDSDGGDKMWAACHEHLTTGRPVIVVVDLFHLPYSTSYHRKHSLMSHHVVLQGYDQEKGLAYITDQYILDMLGQSVSTFQGTVPFDDMVKACASRESRPPARNRWFAVEARMATLPSPLQGLKMALDSSIHQLQPRTGMALAEMIWQMHDDAIQRTREKDLRDRSAYFLRLAIDLRLVSGTRWMFGQFLQNHLEIFPWLFDISHRYESLSQQWLDISKLTFILIAARYETRIELKSAIQRALEMEISLLSQLISVRKRISF